MTLEIQLEPLPLSVDESGAVRVADTRVTLDTIMAAFEEGATAEGIAQQYPSLQLADIYAIIGFYLHQRPSVEVYLQGRRQQAHAVRVENEARSNPPGIRERLLTPRKNPRLT
jgi:uncharacterized protein (DUF433 family)